MSVESTEIGAGPVRLVRSIAAVFAGLVIVVVLSTAIDAILHATGVYPPPEQGLHDPALNLLALAYRVVITIFAGYVTAWIAPSARMRHAVILGLIGTALGILGCVLMIPKDYGPAWYPILLAATALPTCWLGGRLRVGRL